MLCLTGKATRDCYNLFTLKSEVLQFSFQKHLKHQVEMQPFAENQCIDLLGLFFVKQRQGESRERDKGKMKGQARNQIFVLEQGSQKHLKEKEKGAVFDAGIYGNSI